MQEVFDLMRQNDHEKVSRTLRAERSQWSLEGATLSLSSAEEK
jgi:hypothetical protein